MTQLTAAFPTCWCGHAHNRHFEKQWLTCYDCGCQHYAPKVTPPVADDPWIAGEESRLRQQHADSGSTRPYYSGD